MDMVPRPRAERHNPALVSADLFIDSDVLDRLAADPEPPELVLRPILHGPRWVLDICCGQVHLDYELRPAELSRALTEALDALALHDLETGFNPMADELIAAVFS